MSLLGVCLILTLVSAISCQISYGIDVNYAIYSKSEHPNKCVVETPNGIMILDSEQTIRYPGKCSDIYCGRDGFALVYNCDLKYAPDGCEYSANNDFDAIFPHCCERTLKCNNI